MDKYNFDFISLHKPYTILLIIPNILIIIIEKNIILRLFLTLSLSFVSIYYLLKSYLYIDIWITLAIILIFFINSLYKHDNYNGKIRNLLTGDMDNYIYQKDFQNLLSDSDFKYLFSFAKINRLRDKHSNIICGQHDHFEKIYYFAIVPLSSSINLIRNDTTISFIRESSWVGLVELGCQFREHSKNHNSIYNNTGKWLFEISVKNKNYDVVYYEWDKEVKDILLKLSFL